MEFKNLPQITFAERSAAVTEAALIAHYEGNTKKTLYPGDPVRLIFESVAFMFAQVRNEIDYTGKQNLLAYASGDVLPHHGVLVGTDQLTASPALTTLRYTLSAVQSGAIPVPIGSRATPGDNILFATTEAAVIPAGQTYADVAAACTENGTKGNGFVAGQINKFVDPIPYVASVSNVTTSEGGTDDEEPDPYRERIRLAPEEFSTAGPEGAYISRAKKASPLIIDVSVDSPSPGVVAVRPLLVGGEFPGTEILDAVYTACNPKSERPLTDNVSALAPEEVAYSATITYWVDKENETLLSSIQEAVLQAKDDFVLWQKSKLGRDLNPDELIARLKKVGAKRINLGGLTYTALAKSQVARGTITLVFGGLEDG